MEQLDVVCVVLHPAKTCVRVDRISYSGLLSS